MRRLHLAGIGFGVVALVAIVGLVVSSRDDPATQVEVGAPSTSIAPTTSSSMASTTLAPTTRTLVELHEQRWDAVVASDPNLRAVTAPDGTPRYRYVGPNADGSNFAEEPSVVMTAQVSFADISGDGVDEAFVPVVGSHGPYTVLVYYASDTGPRSAEAATRFWSAGGWVVAGRTESFELRGGRLWRTAGVYSELDLGCCPSSRVTTSYKLVEHRLVEAELADVAPAEQGWVSTSTRFATSINSGRYEDVYAVFGAPATAQISADQWRDRFAPTRAAFVQIEDGKNGSAPIVLTTVDEQSGALVVRHERGEIRFAYLHDSRRWVVSALELTESAFVAPAPKAGFVQGTFDLVSVDESAKTALVLLMCTAPVDKTITTPTLLTLALADAHFQLRAADPPATFTSWVEATRSQRHWHIGISTRDPPPAAPKTYISLNPTSNLDTCS
jgi:hypothetical protein